MRVDPGISDARQQRYRGVDQSRGVRDSEHRDTTTGRQDAVRHGGWSGRSRHT